MEFLSILYLAIILEGVVSYIKMFFLDGKIQWQIIFTLVFGVFTAIVYRVDLLEMVGLTTQVPYVGQVFTGVLISRGSNYVFDLLRNMNSLVSNLSSGKNSE